MNVTVVTGVLASVFSGFSLVPQLLKLLKEKKGEHVSLGMLGTLFIGLAFWVWYGFLKRDLIIIISNAFSLVINLIIMILSLKYKAKDGHSK